MTDHRYRAATDSSLQRAIEGALARIDPLVLADLTVVVTDGAVLLKGWVPTDSAARQALAAVGRIPGVKNLIDGLVTDPDLRIRAASAIRDADIRIEELSVGASCGIVTIRGRVASEREREAVDNLLRGLFGVRDVVDKLTMQAR